MDDLFKTPLFNLHDLIVISTAIAATLMLVMQAVTPTKNTVARYYLAIFFSCLLIHSIAILLIWNTQIGLASGVSSTLLLIALTLANLIKGPALFLYVCALTQADFKHKQKHLLHLGAPLLIISLILALGITLGQFKGVETNHHHRLVHDLWLIINGLPALYALACIPVALSISSLMQDFYSNDNAQGKNWLSMLCIGYALYWGWALLSQLFGHSLADFLQLPNYADYLGITSNYLAFTLLLVLFSYNVSITQQQLARALNAAKQPSNTAAIASNARLQAAHSNAIAQPSATLPQKIENLMSDEKPFLQSNLTAEQFASLLGHSSREVSAVLNQHFEKNFFEFINSHRVNYAKQLLLDPSHSNTSITEILYLAGFNSKSAFQRFFKRLTGISPSEYRQQHKTTA